MNSCRVTPLERTLSLALSGYERAAIFRERELLFRDELNGSGQRLARREQKGRMREKWTHRDYKEASFQEKLRSGRASLASTWSASFAPVCWNRSAGVCRSGWSAGFT